MLKLGLLVSALLVGCANSHVPQVVQLADPAPAVATVTSPYKLVITVDGAHCRETQHQPDDSNLVSLLCTDGAQGFIGVLVTITDWAVLRK